MVDYLVVIRFGEVLYSGTLEDLMVQASERVVAAPEHAADVPRLTSIVESNGWAWEADGDELIIAMPAERAADLDRAASGAGFALLRNAKSKMRFDYDFGDGWEHDVVVEAIDPAERGVTYPRLIDGKRACPPEDCGGPLGYRNLLEALADPKHPDHDDLEEWVGGEFDPDHFEVPVW